MSPDEQLFLIRKGELADKDLKKKDIWRLLQHLLRHPVAGLPIGNSSDDEIRQEEKRIARIFFSDIIEPSEVVEQVLDELSYQTFIVLYALAKDALSTYAEAATLLSTNAGAFQQLCDDMNAIHQEKSASEAKYDEKVQLNVVLMAKIISLLSELSSKGWDMYTLAEKGDVALN